MTDKAAKIKHVASQQSAWKSKMNDLKHNVGNAHKGNMIMITT